MSSFGDLAGLAGSLCLDLANTVDWRSTERETDRLQNYADLLRWAAATKALPLDTVETLLNHAQRKPRAAAAAFAHAKALRESIYTVCVALARGEGAPKMEMARLSDGLAPLLGTTRVVSAKHEMDLAWAGATDDLRQPLWLAAWSMVDLLRSADLSLLRECANSDCHWLFLDRSRNKSRRWCAMWNCGNRMKTQRYVARHRG
jgi:predicted RNA-binding Zn ribbon-like protein